MAIPRYWNRDCFHSRACGLLGYLACVQHGWSIRHEYRCSSYPALVPLAAVQHVRAVDVGCSKVFMCLNIGDKVRVDGGSGSIGILEKVNQEGDDMKKNTFLKRLSAALVQFGIILVAYIFFARPSQLYWGATTVEINRSMPGDERRGNPAFLATRAITIEATPENIWPWLVQMGYGRAGFYGYDIIENLGSPRGIHSADRILPEFQEFKVGDEIPISWAAKLFFFEIESNSHIMWSEDKGEYPGAFTWALYPIDETHTRLVSRIGWNFHWSEPNLLFLDLFTEFTDHLAVRKILQGVKGRVEGHPDNFAANTVEFTIYLLLLLLFVFTQFFLVFRPLTLKKWGLGLASGTTWLISWYAPVPLWIGVTLGLLIFYGENKKA